MFSATVPSNRKFSWSTTPRFARKSRSRVSSRFWPSTSTLPPRGRLKAITRLISVLFPDPLEPTSAVVEPAGAWNDTSRSTGTPGVYSNPTPSNVTSPRSASRGRRDSSSWSSVAIDRTSRIRSSPANASLTCVPIDAICTSGAATRPVKNRYITKSPSVIEPARIDRPPTTIISTPIAPMMTVENAVMADTPVIDLATLRNRRWAPCVKTISSRFSAMYDLTIRTPPSASPRRPVTSALIFPRSRKSGRSRMKARAIPPPKVRSTTSVSDVSRQLR